jgi:hypothetical protein
LCQNVITLSYLFFFGFSSTGLKVLVDIIVSRFQKVARYGNDRFDEEFRLYAMYLAAVVLLTVFGSLCICLLFMNAAYKVCGISALIK